MKTFKLYSISLLQGRSGKVEQIPIVIKDGLIINMENQEKTWYIDAVFSEEHLELFQDLESQAKHILVEVIITSKDNHPAAMISKIQTITELSEGISVLFEAKLALKKDDVISSVLKNVIDEGHKEKDLIKEFKHQIRKEDKSNNTHHPLDDLYKSLEESGLYNLN